MEVIMTPDNKTVSVYISEELRKRAEEAGINLSATLRYALEEELGRRDAIANTLSDGIEEHEVELEEYTGIITGKYLGQTRTDEQIYLSDDERVLVYDVDRQRVVELEDPETELTDWLSNSSRDDQEVIADAMRALGLRPRIRL
jgi:hypothetical protein